MKNVNVLIFLTMAFFLWQNPAFSSQKHIPLNQHMRHGGQQLSKPVQGKSQEVIIHAEEMEFHSVLQGITQAVLSGNPEAGPYMAVTKFAAGTLNAPHTHTFDIKIVVLQGTFVYQSDGEEKKLGPGSYLLIPGGKIHTSGATGDEEVVFIQRSENKFDIRYVDKK